MIWAVGIGPGDPELLTLKATRLIESADVAAGFETVLKVVEDLIHKEKVILTYRNQDEALANVAAAHRSGKQCVVCFMGDPNFSGYQLLERVENACGERVELVPGISSVQVVASRARLPFDEAAFVSFHKRGDLCKDREYLASVVRWRNGVIVIPRPWDFMPGAIASFLLENKIAPGTEVTVYERLTTEEREWHGTLLELKERAQEKEFSDMSILVIQKRSG